MQKIIPFLWFDTEAEEATNFYVWLFKNSKINKITRYDEESAKVSGMTKGSVMTIEFELNGQEFIALNGGPQFKFTPAISFLVNCKNQEEVDTLWENLREGGQEEQCGWLKDRFGISWQIVPTVLNKLLTDSDTNKSQRVMKAMLKMKKIDIKELKNAYKGKL